MKRAYLEIDNEASGGGYSAGGAGSAGMSGVVPGGPGAGGSGTDVGEETAEKVSTVSGGGPGAGIEGTTATAEKAGGQVAVKDAAAQVDFDAANDAVRDPQTMKTDGGVDWSKGFLEGLRSSKMAVADGIVDYNRWATANGGDKLDAFTMFPLLQRYDATKSVAENEADERKAKRKAKWEKIGNVLQHLGNFVGTAMGAPSQSIEQAKELTARQQALEDKTKALRQAAGQNLLNVYYKDAADRRAADLNAANIGYRMQQANAHKEDQKRKDAAREDDHAVKASQKALNEERTGQIRQTAERSKELLPLEKEEKKASIAAKRASAVSSYATADKARKDSKESSEDVYKETAAWMNDQRAQNDYAAYAKKIGVEQGNSFAAPGKNLSKDAAKFFNSQMRKKYGTPRPKREIKQPKRGGTGKLITNFDGR